MQNEKKNKPGILLPPAVGYTLSLFIKLIRRNTISPGYYFRVCTIVLINLINMPFRAYERRFINPKFKDILIVNDPIFIIGHWRSGTTHLHNILCNDRRFGYTSTYQSVFPDTLIGKVGRNIFRFFTSALIPGKRKGDNVTLNASYPQEEEFALGDKTSLCFYYFWMFPTRIIDFYKSDIKFENISESKKDSWKDDYRLLIKKALKNTNANHYLSKNPPNTGRIRELIEMFPNAKFIHIHRNPYDVFLSTHNFFSSMLPHLQLQTIDSCWITDSIIDVYKRLMDDFSEQKELIKQGNLVEISYNDLEKKPMALIEDIYEKLNLKGFSESKTLFDEYLDQTKNYKKNKHVITRSVKQKLLNEWGYIMKRYNYSIPAQLEIVED
jgi:omega-hydroxy-beta-dihydromenaquinone-9 sulfotransferase